LTQTPILFITEVNSIRKHSTPLSRHKYPKVSEYITHAKDNDGDYKREGSDGSTEL